jgi:hypothetical protein
MTIKTATQTMTGLRIIAALTTACVVLSTGTGTASAGQRTAAAETSASCKNYELHRYPGSRISRLRYGEVTFRVHVCSNQNPASWAPSAPDPTNNGTGTSLGFSLANIALTVTKTGQNKWNRYARYEGAFTSSTCTPLTGWPCKSTGDWKVRFTITADKKSHKVHLFFQGGSTPDPLLVLYGTP